MEETFKLMKWLQSRVRNIDKPRDYSEKEVLELIEISKLEEEKSIKLDEKIKLFKNKYK